MKVLKTNVCISSLYFNITDLHNYTIMTLVHSIHIVCISVYFYFPLLCKSTLTLRFPFSNTYITKLPLVYPTTLYLLLSVPLYD